MSATRNSSLLLKLVVADLLTPLTTGYLRRMDQDRLQFLFGDAADTVADEFDLDDESDRLAAMDEYAALPLDAGPRGVRMTVRGIVAGQILADEPPEAWATVQRLQAAGMERDEVLSQITMALGEHLMYALHGDTFDNDAYITSLASLPLPSVDDVVCRLIDVVRARQGVSADELIDTVIEQLVTGFGGSTSDTEPGSGNMSIIHTFVERVFDTMVYNELHMIPPDLTVHVGALVDGRTFTHRFTDAEAELEVLSVGFDLGWYSRFDTVEVIIEGRGADVGPEPVEQFSAEQDHLAWRGPDGWLADFEPGSLLAITTTISTGTDTLDSTDADGMHAVATIRVLADEPLASDAVVDAVRAAYDDEFDEPGLPVSGEDIGLWVLFRHGDLFTAPQLPIGELCAAAGLDKYGGRVAHDDSVWRREVSHQRFTQVMDMVPDREWRLLIGRALEVLDDPDADIDDIRTALADCAEPEALDVLADLLFDHHLFDMADQFERSSPHAPGRLFELVERATGVARRPRETATAEYLACVLFERCGEPDTAEQHLKRALDAQPRLGPIVERMGWYRFDRGDARGATKHWRTLDDPPAAIATIQPFLSPTTRKVGRNEPCWCGSGRKFKQCHQNASDLPALPDRVAWLCRKAALWLEHSVGHARRITTEMAAARATGVAEADPLDLGAHDTDAIYDLFDDALGDPIVFDAALQEGGLFQSFLRERRALLPDDEQLLAASWQLVERSVHEILSVDPGVGMTVRDLATGDSIDVRERTASHDMQPGDRYCARIVPDGDTHQMIGGVFPVPTGTEADVLYLCANGDGAELCAWVGRLHQPPQVVRSPGMIDKMFDRSAIDALLDDVDPNDEEAAIAVLGAELSRQARERWLDDNIPALGGMTPREAAADPTRRDQLERLLRDIDERAASASGHGFTPLSYNTPEMRNKLGLD